MRVIAGQAKGRRLKPVPGDTTRPITDRAKEALFSILGDAVDGARFLDLFGGTGAVGIEALSRGAAHATFVDLEPRAVATIRANLAHTGLEGAARVVRGDAFALLRKDRRAAYDIIYIAPPQYKGLWRTALLAIDAAPDALSDEGLAIVQIHPREEQKDLALANLVEVDRRLYGSVRLLFYAKRPLDVEADGAVDIAVDVEAANAAADGVDPT